MPLYTFRVAITTYKGLCFILLLYVIKYCVGTDTIVSIVLEYMFKPPPHATITKDQIFFVI